MLMNSYLPITKGKKRKKKAKYLIFSITLLIIISILVTFSFERKRVVKPYFSEIETPMVIAHRGGSTYPENTLPAFWHSIEIGADVIEFDIHMTKDGQLVVIHDTTVDRTTDGQGRVDSFTLSELKQLDAGFSFAGKDGNFPFRNKGISIPTVREVFEQFPNSYLNLEIKAQYPEISEKLWALIQEYNMENKVLLASFDQTIINHFDKVANGKVAISGGKKEVTKFVVLHKFFLSPFYHPKVDTIQMPTNASIFNLKDKKLIRGARKLNMQTHYWTINDEDEMEQLLRLGADGIITDEPEILIKLLKKLNIR
jgi:glycerophosphoryl diester phosphodiesterase